MPSSIVIDLGNGRMVMHPFYVAGGTVIFTAANIRFSGGLQIRPRQPFWLWQNPAVAWHDNPFRMSWWSSELSID